MQDLDRRAMLLGTVALVASAGAAAAEPPLPAAAPSPQPFARLRSGGEMTDHLMPDEEAERVSASPAPAGPPGRWTSRAPLPLPRSERAQGTARAGRLHVIGGYGEGRMVGTYHHVYEPEADRRSVAAPLPRPRGAAGAVALKGRIYLVGGATAPREERVSLGWHEVYDPAADRWTLLNTLPAHTTTSASRSTRTASA